VAYILQIKDTQYSGPEIEFDIDRMTLRWTTEQRDSRFARIFGSEFRMGIWIDNNDLQSFVDDLVGANEGRFTVDLIDLIGLTNTMSWHGYILADLITIDDRNTDQGYLFEVKALDGLARLKNIDYNNAGTAYTGKETFVEHVLNCINKLSDIVDLFDPTETLLNVVCNWHETSYTYASSINPLSRSRVSHRAFYYDDTKGNRVFRSCFEVLDEICKAWGMRFFFSGDAFWMLQVNEYASADNITVFEYDKSGTETVSSGQDLSIANNQTADNSGTDLRRLAGAKFKFYAPLRRVEINYNHIKTRNLIPGSVWDEVTNDAVTVPDIDSNSGAARFSYSGTLNYRTSYAGVFHEHYLLFRFKINVGSYYYKKDVAFYPGNVYNDAAPEWVNTGVEYFDIVVGPLTEQAVHYQPFPIQFTTDEIPEDGDLEIDFEYVQAVKRSDASDYSGTVSTFWNLSGSYLELIESGDFEDQNDVNRYASENDAEASKVLELETFIGDGPNLTSPGHIEVLDDSSAWVLSDGWRVGNSGSTKAHSQLLANEIISGQLTPVRRFVQASFQNIAPATNRLMPHKYIDYDSKRWVFQGGVFDFKTEITQAEWWVLSTATGYTEQTTVFIPRGGDDGPPSSGGSSGTESGGSGTGGSSGVGGSGGGSGNTVQMIQETVTESGSATLPAVTKNNGELPSNGDQVMLFGYDPTLGGTVPIHPDEYSIDAPNGQITLNWTPRSGEKFLIVWFVIS